MKEWLGRTCGVQGSSMLFSMRCSMFAVKHIYYPFFLKSCFMKCFLERLIQENWERLVGFLNNILWTEAIKCFFSLCVLSRRCICHLIKTGGKEARGQFGCLGWLGRFSISHYPRGPCSWVLLDTTFVGLALLLYTMWTPQIRFSSVSWLCSLMTTSDLELLSSGSDDCW